MTGSDFESIRAQKNYARINEWRYYSCDVTDHGEGDCHRIRTGAGTGSLSQSLWDLYRLP